MTSKVVRAKKKGARRKTGTAKRPARRGPEGA